MKGVCKYGLYFFPVFVGIISNTSTVVMVSFLYLVLMERVEVCEDVFLLIILSLICRYH